MSGSFRPEGVSNAGQSWFVSTSNRQKLEIVLDCPENVVLSFLNLAVTFGCLVDEDRSREAFYIVYLLQSLADQDLAISEKLCLLKLNLRSFVRKFLFRLSKALGIFTILFSYFRCRKFLSRSRCSFLLLQKTFLFPVSQGHYLFELFPTVPF